MKTHIQLMRLLCCSMVFIACTRETAEKNIAAEATVSVAPVVHKGKANDLNPTPCGGFDFYVTFTLDPVSPKGGYFVQKITIEPDIKLCDNTSDPGPLNKKIVYWEAWPVSMNKGIFDLRDKGSIDYDDNFREPDHPSRFNKVTFTGELKFFEGLALPATFKTNNPETNAGILASTTTEPDFWKNDKSNATAHTANSNWNCCVSVATHVITTDPKTATSGSLRMQNIVSDTDKLDATGKLILQIPAWTLGYDTLKENQLTTIVKQLAVISPGSLRTSLQTFYDAFGYSTDEMSKVYLLLRALYTLPSAADRNTVKVFGGWRHPSTLDPNLPFDLSWPIAVNANLHVTVTSDFTGYIGVTYDAVGEFDFFNASYAKRVF